MIDPKPDKEQQNEAGQEIPIPAAVELPEQENLPPVLSPHAQVRLATAQIAEKNLQLSRDAFAWLFFGTLAVITILIVITVAVLIGVATGKAAGLDKSLIARLLQIAFGMVLGTTCLFLGLSWLGSALLPPLQSALKAAGIQS
jgi:ABC-type antimicrobial peptide transport system permease subunit